MPFIWKMESIFPPPWARSSRQDDHDEYHSRAPADGSWMPYRDETGYASSQVTIGGSTGRVIARVVFLTGPRIQASKSHSATKEGWNLPRRS